MQVRRSFVDNLSLSIKKIMGYYVKTSQNIHFLSSNFIHNSNYKQQRRPLEVFCSTVNCKNLSDVRFVRKQQTNPEVPVHFEDYTLF